MINVTFYNVIFDDIVFMAIKYVSTDFDFFINAILNTNLDDSCDTSFDVSHKDKVK